MLSHQGAPPSIVRRGIFGRLGDQAAGLRPPPKVAQGAPLLRTGRLRALRSGMRPPPTPRWSGYVGSGSHERTEMRAAGLRRRRPAPRGRGSPLPQRAPAARAAGWARHGDGELSADPCASYARRSSRSWTSRGSSSNRCGRRWSPFGSPPSRWPPSTTISRRRPRGSGVVGIGCATTPATWACTQPKPRGRWYFRPALTDARLAALEDGGMRSSAGEPPPPRPRQLPGSVPLLPVKDRAA